MLDLPVWLLASLGVIVFWGAVGLTQKLATYYFSAEWTTISLIIGYLLLLPFLLSGFHPSAYNAKALGLALGAGLFNMLGTWTLFRSMSKGGKASIVMPLTALYPALVAISSPYLFGDHVSARQVFGILLGLASGVLLSREASD